MKHKEPELVAFDRGLVELGPRRVLRSRWFAVALLTMLLVGGYSVARVIYPPSSTTVSVGEPLVITPATTSVALFPNECSTLDYNITNTGSANVSITWSVIVTGTPPDGSAADITLTPSNGTFSAAPGMNVLTVTACASNGAVPGDYTVTATFQRD